MLWVTVHWQMELGLLPMCGLAGRWVRLPGCQMLLMYGGLADPFAGFACLWRCICPGPEKMGFRRLEGTLPDRTGCRLLLHLAVARSCLLLPFGRMGLGKMSRTPPAGSAIDGCIGWIGLLLAMGGRDRMVLEVLSPA
ncbi:hypothetical protein ACLOJK_034965 [Asimina triloba]